MFQLVMSAFLILIAVGCGGPRYADYFPYHDDGTAKPKVALMPLINSSLCDLPWDFSEEISEGIYYKLMDSGWFYAVSPKEMGAGWAKRNEIDFFSNDFSYARDFSNTDFIVATELIEYSVQPCDPCTLIPKPSFDHHPSNLLMTVRLRLKIIDIRYREPKIVLYEVFKTQYAGIPGTVNHHEVCWKGEGYCSSYCGMGHERVIRSLAKRLEEVIWSSK